MSYVVEVEPVCVEQGTIKVKGKAEILLRMFQEEVVDFFNSPYQYLFLTGPTGSGKTLTLLAPLLSNILYGTSYDGVLGVYPTKPLTIDQYESIKATLEKLSGSGGRHAGAGLLVYDVEFDVEKSSVLAGRYWGRVGLVLLTKDNIEKLREALAAESGRSVLDAIRRNLLAESVDYLITLAVPEYPYLMLSHMYRSHHDLAKFLDLASSGGFVYRLTERMLSLMNSENELREYVEEVSKLVKTVVDGRVAERSLADIASALLPPIVFFDEFHTWNFYELPTAIALVLLHRLASLTSIRGEMYRVVFSSATPNQYVLDILSKVADTKAVKDVRAEAVDCTRTGAVKIKGKTIIEFYSIETKTSGYLSWVEVERFLPEVVKEKSREILASKRAIVLGKRVYSVEKSAELFHAETKVIPTVVTGFAPPPGFHGKEELVARRSEGEVYVFGNYAVELGVDLRNMTYSIITATSLGELLQRMGRSGRGGIDSKVVILVPDIYVNVIIFNLGEKRTISYRDLVGLLSRIMVDEPEIKKLGNEIILKSNIGKIRLYLPLATYILALVLRYRDKPRDIEPVLSEFRRILQAVGFDKRFYSWLRKRVSRSPRVLAEISSFRLSPSVEYIRRNGNQVSGEANLITLLSNYKVSIDTSEVLKLVIHDAMRSEISSIAAIEIRKPDTCTLSSINRYLLPGRLVVELLKRMGAQHTILLDIIERLDIPLYVIYTGTEDSVLEVLHAYGHAIAVKHSGRTYAYLLLL